MLKGLISYTSKWCFRLYKKHRGALHFILEKLIKFVDCNGWPEVGYFKIAERTLTTSFVNVIIYIYIRKLKTWYEIFPLRHLRLFWLSTLSANTTKPNAQRITQNLFNIHIYALLKQNHMQDPQKWLLIPQKKPIKIENHFSVCLHKCYAM